MVVAGLGAQADLFDFNLFLCPASFFFFLFPLVKEFAVINYPAYRRFGLGRYFDQVEVGCFGFVQGFLDGDNPDVVPACVDQTNLRDSNSFIYPVV